MALVIDDSLMRAASISEQELKLEIGILLYQQQRFSMAQACRFVEMPRVLFMKELGKRKIPISYDLEELTMDLRTLGIAEDGSSK